MRFRYSYRKLANLFVNSGDPDQTPRSAASDLGLHCLPNTLLRVSRLQWVKNEVNVTKKLISSTTCFNDYYLKISWKFANQHKRYRTYIKLFQMLSLIGFAFPYTSAWGKDVRDIKKMCTLLFLYKNTCCGYSLERPQWGFSNEYHNMFLWWNNKNINYFWWQIAAYMELWNYKNA